MDVVEIVRIVLLVVFALGAVLLLRLVFRRAPEEERTHSEGVTDPEAAHAAGGPAAREFAGAAPQFEGLYEGLYQIYMGDLPAEKALRILRGWETRVQNAGTPALSAEWSHVVTRATGTAWLGEPEELDRAVASEIAQEWYSLLVAWGVARDTRRTLRVDDQARDRYILNGDPMDGETVSVELPAWTCGSQVAEKGLAYR